MANSKEPTDLLQMPQMRSGFKPVVFHQTVQFSEQQLYRRLIRTNLSRTPRELMIKLANLWFRHRSANRPIAPGYEYLATALGVCKKSIQRAMRALQDMGFVRFLFGGSGRGRTCRFAIDLTAIREAFAPDLLSEEKGDSLPSPLIEEQKRGSPIARRWLWKAGILGRCDDFRARLARCLSIDRQATWRRFAPIPLPRVKRYGDGTINVDTRIPLAKPTWFREAETKGLWA